MTLDSTNTSSESQIQQAQSTDKGRDAFSQEALKLFQCKDGSLVTSPLDCTRSMEAFGGLSIDDNGAVLAGRTIRRGNGGWTTDGGKVELT